MTSELTALLACDLLLMLRAMEADGVPLSEIARRTPLEWRSLQTAISSAVAAGVRSTLRGVWVHELIEGRYMILAMEAPAICRALETPSSAREAAVRLMRLWHYALDSRSKAGIRIIGFSREEVVYIYFDHGTIDMTWYRSGLRLSQAWRHLTHIPERIRALEQELRGETEEAPRR